VSVWEISVEKMAEKNGNSGNRDNKAYKAGKKSRLVFRTLIYLSGFCLTIGIAADFINEGLFIIVPYLLWFWYRLIVDILELVLPPLVERKEKEKAKAKAAEESYTKNAGWLKNASWLKEKEESKEDEKPYKKKEKRSFYKIIVIILLCATVFYYMTGVILYNLNVCTQDWINSDFHCPDHRILEFALAPYLESIEFISATFFFGGVFLILTPFYWPFVILVIIIISILMDWLRK